MASEKTVRMTSFETCLKQLSIFFFLSEITVTNEIGSKTI